MINRRNKRNWILPLLVAAGMVYLIGLISVHIGQRGRIFLPTRGVVDNFKLDPWLLIDREIGFKREVEAASRVWPIRFQDRNSSSWIAVTTPGPR